jgi:hypothetical protein
MEFENHILSKTEGVNVRRALVVLRSLSKNARDIFILLAKYHLANEKAADFTGTPLNTNSLHGDHMKPYAYRCLWRTLSLSLSLFVLFCIPHSFLGSRRNWASWTGRRVSN